jgi:hypothetical protein
MAASDAVADAVDGRQRHGRLLSHTIPSADRPYLHCPRGDDGRVHGDYVRP